MQKRRWMSVILALALAAGLVGCGAKETDGGETNEPNQEETDGNEEGENGEVNIFGYDEPITITSMMATDNLATAPEEYTLEDNPFVNLYKENGINVEYKISGLNEDLQTKLNMAITTGDLPDIMSLTAQQFKELYEDGQLADLTDAYETYASDRLKELLNQDGGEMLQNCYIDGRLYGIATPAEWYDYISVVAIRSDWLEECGLSAPETMEDLWNIAKTFKDSNMGGTCTIGIGMNKAVTTLLQPTVNLLNAYHAYVNIWLEDEEGALVNSTIQPEMKEALFALAEKYQEGLIDPEFATKEYAQMVEDALAGRSGIMVGAFTLPFDLVNGAKEGQEWSYYAMPSVDGELVRYQESLAFGGATCVSAECENPEAVIKLYNLFAEYFPTGGEYGETAVNNFAYPTVVYEINKNVDIHNRYVGYLQAGEDPLPEEELSDGDYVNTVEQAEAYRLNNDMEGYIMWTVFGENSTECIVADAVENDAYLVSKYTAAPTDLMNEYNSTLNTLTEQMITNIISGSQPVDYFDEFVSEWLANGGEEITGEVNEWYQNR